MKFRVYTVNTLDALSYYVYSGYLMAGPELKGLLVRVYRHLSLSGKHGVRRDSGLGGGSVAWMELTQCISASGMPVIRVVVSH